MKITAAICTYNREKYLPIVLKSILGQTMDSADFEVVVVNNNSPGNTEEICLQFEKDHPNINFIYTVELNQGLSFGRNTAIETARTEFITFLDDDAYIAPDYFQRVVEKFEANQDVAAIGGKIHLDYEDLVPNWENKYVNPLLGFFDIGDEEKIMKFPDYPRGSNMSFRMSVFETIGNFNVELGRIGNNILGGEEKDLFARINGQKNLKVLYDPNAVVYHFVPLERTGVDFVVKQGVAIGMSERIRSKNVSNFEFLKSRLNELKKWIGSIGLYFLFLLKGQPAKGKIILTFRKAVTKGLLTKV